MKKNKKTISIGIPCFNEEQNVAQAYKAIRAIAKKNDYRYELIFVDNGSTDSTREEIKKLCKKDKDVIGVFLSRNFGPEASLQAASEHASGDAFILLFCDLQEPPELIPQFISGWEQGHDIVVGVYKKTQEQLLMRIARSMFYKFFKRMSNIEVPVNASGVGLIDRRALDAINRLPEKYRFFRGLRAWVGFNTAYVSYNRRPRLRGKSSYGFFSYIKHAERSFFGFSYLPLDIMIYFGFLLVFLSFLFILIYLLAVIIYRNPFRESIAVIVSIAFFGGIQLMAISTIGKYIQVIVEETKARPVYIVEDILNKKNRKY
ncbi:MAG TPA: glycosyltransferase family 2 protein [Candidatus Saccharimonadales bacterium]|nr:glycosyltransferase family 2 protein [Candidatus Saccharimonadales bacterium]